MRTGLGFPFQDGGFRILGLGFRVYRVWEACGFGLPTDASSRVWLSAA